LSTFSSSVPILSVEVVVVPVVFFVVFLVAVDDVVFLGVLVDVFRLGAVVVFVDVDVLVPVFLPDVLGM